nr:UDP-glucuronosyltransferase 1-7C-like [Onthophagus taurus]
MIIFDVIYAECYLPLIDHFGLPPVVAVTAFGMYSYINDVMGQTTESYIPYFALPYTDHMNFFERIHSSFYLTMESIIRLNNLKNLNEISKETFGPKSRSIEDLFKEISLMFPNDHPILDYPKPTAPNVIPIGGVQVKPPKKLDKDLQKILDDSKQGVIFVSLGSNFIPKYYGKHAIKSFKESFSKLNQTILWKFDDDDLPKNVITRKWFSQTDILAHPNTKLFITHCGGLSTQETIIRGVPVIGIPLFFDQYSQAGKIQSINGGVVLKYWELTTENVYNSIMEVLSNPVYKNNMKRLSTLYNEQPENLLEKFLLWVDYVLKHGHLNHLSLGSREMRWYQINNWDVYALGVDDVKIDTREGKTEISKDYVKNEIMGDVKIDVKDDETKVTKEEINKLDIKKDANEDVTEITKTDIVEDVKEDGKEISKDDNEKEVNDVKSDTKEKETRVSKM